ncbi:hypothetical protein CsSME_00042013 [Camellia sinensis var. sinensis]
MFPQHRKLCLIEDPFYLVFGLSDCRVFVERKNHATRK